MGAQVLSEFRRAEAGENVRAFVAGIAVIAFTHRHVMRCLPAVSSRNAPQVAVLDRHLIRRQPRFQVWIHS